MGVARMGEREGRRFGEGKLDPGKRPTCLSVSQLNVFLNCVCAYFNSKGKVNSGVWVLLLVTRSCHGVTEVTYLTTCLELPVS